MYLTRTKLSRRPMLKGMGVSLGLPLLESMAPAAMPWQKTAAAASTRTRFAAIEMVHGSAGATAFGQSKNMWTPAADGHTFDLSATSMAPLEPYRDYLTIVS